MTDAATAAEPLPATVLEALDQARRSVPRLVLIVGAPNTGKTALADAIAESAGTTRMNLGLELSRELLPISSARRPIDVEDLIRHILPTPGDTPLVIDNTEILFESYLKLAPPQTRPDRRPDKKSLNKQIPISNQQTKRIA